MTGNYTFNVFYTRDWGANTKYLETNSSKIFIDRENIDISCFYVDDIYLQTKTSPFYHNITIFGSIFEAGEWNTLNNVDLNVFWREANGTDSNLGKCLSSQIGQISTNFNRTRTVHYDLMRAYIQYNGNNIYKPADSRYPSPYFSKTNQNKHKIKNAQDGEIDFDSLSPGNFSRPRTLTLSNMNRTIWSPHGNDQDIEDWDFSISPFTDPVFNTPYYGSNEDGFDHWVESNASGTIGNNTQRYIAPIDRDIYPIDITRYLGTFTNLSDYYSLMFDDEQGITIYGEEITTNANSSYFLNKMRLSFFTLFPVRQASSLNLVLQLKDIGNRTFTNFTIHQIDNDGNAILIMNTTDGNLISNTFNAQVEDISDNIITFEVMVNSTSVFDITYDLFFISIIPVNHSLSRYGWKPNWNALTNSTVYFESIGGNSKESLSYYLGTDVHVPEVPFYTLQSTYFGLNLSYHKIGSFNLSFDILFTTIDRNGSIHEERLEIWSHTNGALFGSRSIKLNLTQLFGVSNFTYFTFIAKSTEMDIGEEFTLEILDFYINSRCKLAYIPSSIMEQYSDNIQVNNAIQYPDEVDYQFDPSYLINNAVINSTLDHVLGSLDRSYMENNSLWTFKNGTASSLTDINGDMSSDYNLSSSQIIVPFNSTPELRTLNYSHIQVSGSNAPDVFSNPSLNQVYLKKTDTQSTLRYSVNVNNSLGEVSYHNNTGKNPNNYALLTPTSEIILRLPVDLSRTNIRFNQLQEKVSLSIQILRQFSIYDRKNNPFWFQLRRINAISYNNYTYKDYMPMSGFNALNVSLNLTTESVATFDITKEVISCYKNNITDLYFYFRFRNDTAINSSTILTIADYDYLSNHSMDYTNICNVFYQITFQDDFEVIFKVTCPDLAKLTSITLNCRAGVMNGKLVFSIMTMKNVIPTNISVAAYNSSSSIKTYPLSISKDKYYSNDTILIKMEYIGSRFYSTNYMGMTGAIVDDLKIIYHSLNCSAALYVSQPKYEGYQLNLHGMITNNTSLVGSVFLNNEDSVVPIIDLFNENFTDFNDIEPYYIPFNLLNNNSYYQIGIRCISSKKFDIIFTNITINGGIHPLDIYEEKTDIQYEYFDFNAIIALQKLDVFYKITNENQTVLIESIETQKYLDKSDFSSIQTIGWDELYNCTGLSNITSFGATINLTNVFNMKDGIATRFVRVGFTLTRGNVAKETPILYNITLYATRTKVGNLTSLYHIADGDELIFGFPSSGVKEFVFTFTLEDLKNEPFMLVSLDYIFYPEFSDFPGLLLQNYSVIISNPERTISEKIPARQRFYQEIETFLITNISKYISSGNFLLIYTLNSSYEIDFHLDYVAGCFYSNASTLLNIPHAIALELDRASNLNTFTPIFGQLWKGLDTSHNLNGASNTALSTNWTFNNNTRIIKMDRTTKEYYGRIIQPGSGSDEEIIIKPPKTIDMNGLYAGTPLNRNSYTLTNTEIHSHSNYGGYVYIQGSTNSDDAIGAQYDFSSNVPAGTDHVKFKTDVEAYLIIDKMFYYLPVYFFVPITVSVTYNDVNYGAGTTDWIDYANVNTVKLKVSFPISCISSFFISSAYVMMRIYSVSVATRNEHTLQFGLSDPTADYAYVNSTTYLHVIPKLNAYELDGIVLDGSLDYYVSEYARNMNPRTNARVRLFVDYGINNTNIIADPDEQVDDYDYNWNTLTFPHYSSLNIDQPSTTFGSSLHRVIFNYDATVDGAYKFYLPRSIFFNNSYGEPCAIIRVRLSFSYPKDFNTIPNANDPFNAYLSYQTYVGWNNIRIKLLYSDKKFKTQNDNINTFGFSFDVSKEEISELIETGFDLSDIWYFGTKLDLSIYPHWADQPFTSYVQFNKQDISYKTWLGIESRVSGKIKPISLPAQNQEYKPLNFIKNSYELIFTQSEDRVSLDDPNAMLIDTTNIDDYFVLDNSGHEVLRFYVNVSIKWNNIEQYNTRRNEPGASARKTITILVKDITTIDILYRPQRKDVFDQIPLPMDIPQPKNDIFKKVTGMSLSISGTLEIDSFELFHTVYQTIGFRIVLFTSTGGTEVLGDVSIDSYDVKNFTITVDIPTLKLDNNERIELAIQIGVFNFFFTGLYDDVGYVYLKINEIESQYTYNTGFSDVWSDELFIERPISYNLDVDIPGNIDAILVKTEIDYAMQCVIIDDKGVEHEYGSPQIPTLLAYNFVTKTYHIMVCFSEKSNVFEYVLDRTLCSNLTEFVKNGSLKMVFILDGRTGEGVSIGNQMLSYVHLDIIKMQMEFLDQTTTDETEDSMQRIKPSNNLSIPNDWLMPYTHRQILTLSNTNQTNVMLSTKLNFTMQSSEGIFQDQYAVVDFTGNELVAQLTEKSLYENYTTSAHLECLFLSSTTPGIIYFYWADYNATTAWDQSFNTTIPQYSGNVSIRMESFTEFYPYSFSRNDQLMALQDIDYQLSGVPYINNTASIPIEFDFSNLDYSSYNITSIKLRIAEISSITTDICVSMFDYYAKVMRNYPVTHRIVDNFYFAEIEQKISILNLDPSEVISFLTPDNKLAIIVESVIEGGNVSLWKINMVEIEIHFDEIPKALVNASFDPYIVDQDSIASLEFYDIFDGNLEGWIGDVDEYGIINGALTKTSVPTPHWWYWWQYFMWWHPAKRASNIFVNKTKDATDYYADFKVKIQNTPSCYKTASWLVHSGEYHRWCEGTQAFGLLFTLHAYQSSGYSANELHIWKKSKTSSMWRLVDVINVPFRINVDAWYRITMYVNNTRITVKINGTSIYSNYITINDNSGYFGFRSNYANQFLIDDVVISDVELPGGYFQGYFSNFTVNMTDSSILQYEDQLSVNLSSIPPNYSGSIADQKFELLVNSTDGWLLLDEAPTDSKGVAMFNIDTVDLATFDILGSNYPKMVNYSIINDTTTIAVNDTFENGLSQWTSEDLSSFTTENGYLEKEYYSYHNSILTQNGLTGNYSISFDFMKNPDYYDNYIEYYIDIDATLRNGYVYRIYTADDYSTANVIELYKLSNGWMSLIDHNDINEEILGSTWYHLETKVGTLSNGTTIQQTLINDEIVFESAFPTGSYYSGDYFGFNFETPNNDAVDNVLIYNGTKEISKQTFEPCQPTSTYGEVVKQNNVRYLDQGIPRVENMYYVEAPYSIINNSLGIGMNLNLSFLMNAFYKPFDYTAYYGLKVGVLLPYDEIAESVDVYIEDIDGEVGRVTLSFADLNKLYNEPNERAVIINGTRMLKTDVWISLAQVKEMNASRLKYLGVQMKRIAPEYSQYTEKWHNSIIGICSIQLLRQLNNYSYSNYQMAERPEFEVCVHYRGSGKIISSKRIFEHIQFQRRSASIELTGTREFSIKYGEEFALPLQILQVDNSVLPACSRIAIPSVLLLVKKKNEWTKAALDNVDAFNQEPLDILSFEGHFRPFVSAGNYSEIKFIWLGNGLFNPAEVLLNSGTPLEIRPSDSNITISAMNGVITYSQSAQITGLIQDSNSEMIKDKDFMFYENNFTSNHIHYLQITDLPNYNYTTNYTGGQFKFDADMAYGKRFTFAPTNDTNLINNYHPINYMNIFRLAYYSNTQDVELTIQLKYNGTSVIQNRSLKLGRKDTWTNLYVETEPDQYAFDQNLTLTGYALSIKSLVSQNVELCIKDIQIWHMPLVYLQVNSHLGWQNLALGEIEIRDMNTSEYQLKLFPSDQLFLMKNIYQNYWKEEIHNASLLAGDYECRIYYPGYINFFNPSYSNLFIRVNPIQTAIYYLHDGEGNVTAGGIVNTRKYNSTTLFALEAGKPYTMVQLGCTWGDNKSLEFKLCPKNAADLKGIPNKPLWVQIGIVPNSYYGLMYRDYLADYYPMTRDIESSMLFANTYFIQNKYSRPILYDYYDLASGSQQFYGPVLWQVYYTNIDGIIRLNWTLTSEYLNYLKVIFSGRDLSNIEKDLYVRVFYSNLFSWNDMVLPIRDSIHTNLPITCSWLENQKDESRIYNKKEAEYWKGQNGGIEIYFDGIYSSSYAEGFIHVVREGLSLRAQNVEVSLTGYATDTLSLVSYLNETERSEVEDAAIEPIVKVNEWNKFLELKPFFFLMDEGMKKIIVGDENSTMSGKVDPISGEITFDMNTGSIPWIYWQKVIPGYYKVACYVPESYYYEEASVTYSVLVKSPYTYNFIEPAMTADLQSLFQSQAIAAAINKTSNEYIYNFTKTDVYPVLCGYIWQENLTHSDGLTTSICINDFPVYKREIFPGDRYEVNIPLKSFESLEKLNISLSSYNVDADLSFEEPWESNITDDRVFFDLYMKIPTNTNPIENTGETICNLTQIVKNNVDFSSFTGNSIVQLSHVVKNRNSYENFQIAKGNLLIEGVPRHGILMYPDSLNFTTQVFINLDQVGYKINKSKYLVNLETGVDILAGWQLNTSASFLNSVRECVFTDPVTDNSTSGLRIAATNQYTYMLTYENLYVPYLGFFNGRFLPTRTLLDEEYIDVSVTITYGSYIKSNLWSTRFTNKSSGLQSFLINTTGVVDSLYFNVTIFVNGKNIVKPIGIILYNSSIQGFEDVIAVSTHMPKRRAALYSTNFLYYFIRNPKEINLENETTPTVKVAVENRRNNTQNKYQNLEEALQIYKQADVTTFVHDPQEPGATGYTAHGKSQNYTFPNDPDTGIFIRSQVFGQNDKEIIDLYTGFVVLYHQNASGDNVEITKRKVSLFIKPKEWVINGEFPRIIYNGTSGAIRVSFDNTRLDRGNYVDSTWVRASYRGYSAQGDKVWKGCNKTEFYSNWNKSASSKMSWDIWTNSAYFTLAEVYQSGTYRYNLMDFYPGATTDWTSFEALETVLRINNTYYADRAELRIYNDTYDGMKPVSTLNISLTCNSTSIPVSWNLAAIPQSKLANIKRVDILLVFNASRIPQVPKKVIYFETSGIALKSRASAIKMYVKYSGDNSEYEVSPSFDRNFFASDSSITDSMPLATTKEIEYISIKGTQNMKLDLFKLELIQNHTLEAGTDPITLQQFSLEFDPMNERLEDQRKLTLNIEPVNWTKKFMNVQWSYVHDPTMFIKYRDRDYDGIYDRMEIYEDYMGGEYGDGINDQYSIDFENDGFVDKIYSKTMTQQHIETGEDSYVDISEYRYVETDLMKSDLFGYTMRTYESTLRYTSSNLVRFPYERIRKVSNFVSNPQRADTISEDRDAWRLNRGIDDFETHYRYTWNSTKDDYDVVFWHDWAAILDVSMIGSKDSGDAYYPVIPNLHGILDKGVTQVPINPAITALGEQDQYQTGTYFWVNSYNLTQHVDNWDMAFVIVYMNDTTNSFSQVSDLQTSIKANTVAAISVILDSNRDHTFEPESSSENDPPYFDQYYPFWMVSPGLRSILKEFAYDNALADWCANMAKPASIIKIIVEVVVTYIIAWIVSFIVAKLWPGGEFAHLGLIVSFFTFVFMCFLGPLIDQWFDPDAPDDRASKYNKHTLMQTSINTNTLPSDHTYRGSTPKLNFNYYKAHYRGWSLGVYGTFDRTSSIAYAPSGADWWFETINYHSGGMISTTDKDGNPQVVIPGEIYGYDPDSPTLITGEEFGWQLAFNPIGLLIDVVRIGFNWIAGFFGFQEDRQGYEQYAVQKEVLEAAYVQVLGFDRTRTDIRILPYFKDGRPLFIAVPDDLTVNNGTSQFWAENTNVWKQIEKNAIIFSVKYQSFYTSNWEVALYNFLVTVVKIIAVSIATQGGISRGTSAAGGTGKALTAKGVLKSIVDEYICDEWVLNNLLGGIADLAVMSIWNVDITDYTPFGMSFGDIIEWIGGIKEGYDQASNQRQFQEIVTELQEKLQSVDKQDFEGMKPDEKQDVLRQNLEAGKEQMLQILQKGQKLKGQYKNALNMLAKIVAMTNTEAVFKQLGFKATKLKYGTKVKTEQDQKVAQKFMESTFIRLASESLMLGAKRSISFLLQETTRLSQKAGYLATDAYFFLEIVEKDGSSYSIGEFNEQTKEFSNKKLMSLDISEFFADYEFAEMRIVDPDLKFKKKAYPGIESLKQKYQTYEQVVESLNTKLKAAGISAQDMGTLLQFVKRKMIRFALKFENNQLSGFENPKTVAAMFSTDEKLDFGKAQLMYRVLCGGGGEFALGLYIETIFANEKASETAETHPNKWMIPRVEGQGGPVETDGFALRFTKKGGSIMAAIIYDSKAILAFKTGSVNQIGKFVEGYYEKNKFHEGIITESSRQAQAANTYYRSQKEGAGGFITEYRVAVPECSIEQYRKILDAFKNGLEKAKGKDIIDYKPIIGGFAVTVNDVNNPGKPLTYNLIIEPAFDLDVDVKVPVRKIYNAILQILALTNPEYYNSFRDIWNINVKK